MPPVDRLIAPTASSEDVTLDRAVRPKRLADYIGQQAMREQLEIFMLRAPVLRRWIILLLFGPPGLGEDHAGAYHRRRDGHGVN